jgi:hypothetical protein
VGRRGGGDGRGRGGRGAGVFKRAVAAESAAGAVSDETGNEFFGNPRIIFANLGRRLIPSAVLRLSMGFRQNMIQLFSDCNRLPLVTHNAHIMIIGNQAEHLLGPEPKLCRLDGRAFWVPEDRQDVVVPLLRNQRFVALLGGEGEDVVVEEILEVDAGGETLVIWRREVVKGVANFRGGGGELLLLLGAGIGQCCRKLLLLLVELVLMVLVVVVMLLLLVVVMLVVLLVLLVVLLLLLLLVVLLLLVEPKRIGLEVERARHGKPPRASAGRRCLVVVPVLDRIV